MKLSKFFILSVILSSIIGFSFAESGGDCIRKDLGNNSTVCINIDKGEDDQYNLNVEVTCKVPPCSINCRTVLPNGNVQRTSSYNGNFRTVLPNGNVQYTSSCNGNFRYNGNTTEKIEIYINEIHADVASRSFKFIGYYDFLNGIRGDGDGDNKLEFLDISVGNENITLGERVELNIETNEDYTGKINISSATYYGGGYSREIFPRYINGERDYINRVNGAVFSKYSDEWRQGYIIMEPSDNGKKTIHNLVKFVGEGAYSIGFVDSNGLNDSIGIIVTKATNNNQGNYGDGGNVEEYDELLENIDDIDDNSTNNGGNNNTGGEGENEGDNNEEDEYIMREKQEKLTDNFNDALNYGKEKNYDKAIEVLKEIISNEGTIERDNYEIAKRVLRIFEQAIEKNTKKDVSELNRAINWMYEKGLTIFNDPDSFMAYNGLRRDEAAKFFVKYAKEVMGMIPDYSKQGCIFEDLDQAWSDLKDVIIESCQLGLFQGSKGKFMPTQQLTNAQALTVFMRLREGYKDESGSHFANNYYESAHAQGFLSDTPLDNKANFDVNTTRGDVAKMLFRGKN